MNEQVNKLIRKRGSLKKRLTDFGKFVSNKNNTFIADKSLNRATIIELESRLDKINTIVDEFQTIHDEIEILTEIEEPEICEAFENDYYLAIASAKELLERVNNKGEGSLAKGNIEGQESTSAIQDSNIKLPTIQLPKYSGKYTNWLEFRDTYEALIHNSEKLSSIQKFYYLKSTLEGDAAKVIASMEISSMNYENAWQLLRDRYENKNLLVQNHVRALFNISPINKESPIQFRETVDTITQHLRALKTLEQPVDHWDAILVYIISSKFDSVTAREWESTKNVNELPTLNDIKNFLKKKAEILETLNLSTNISNKGGLKKWSKGSTRAFFTSSLQCYYCRGSHTIYNCSDFKKLSVENKKRELQAKKLCPNCLRRGHNIEECGSGNCRLCKLKHNTLLHPVNNNTSSDNASPVNLTVRSHNQNQYTVLSTAEVFINNRDQSNICRVLLDCGSQSNFIKRDTAALLGLKVIPINKSVSGLGNFITNICGRCKLTILSRINSYKTTIDCLVVTEITDNLPHFDLSQTRSKIPDDIILADSNFDKPSSVELLIGAGTFWEILVNGRQYIDDNEPILQRTRLGWVLAGPLSWQPKQFVPQCNFNKTIDIQEQIVKFWELEECPTITDKLLTEEERQCETHFSDTYQRGADGRFEVSIPYKKPIEFLGDSKTGALKRFYNLERKLQSQPQLKEQYSNFLNEYEAMDHMRRVTKDMDESPKIHYYLPHHCVLNENSKTTKLRVVFDGSFRTSTGYSLNDLQSVGPTIQSDLLAILLRFRQNNFAISADITKMYRQVRVCPEDQALQCILWRDHPSKPVETFQLQTVTYGTAAASFQAIRCLKQLALDASEQFPEASIIIQDDFYVDDLLTGVDDEAEATTLCEQIDSILRKGCFPLRKWISNNPNILPRNNSNDEYFTKIAIGEGTKTLGLFWVASEDNLIFNVQITQTDRITKRSILAVIGQIFDPLGLISAITIVLKVLLQSLWQKGLDWDDDVPLPIQEIWLNFLNEINTINQIKIPRNTIGNSSKLEVHGFADASEKAYGCCVYIRSLNTHGHFIVKLLCAKTRVAPLKTTTIPRLELCAALMLAKLVKKVVSSSRKIFQTIYLWSDSQIVLAWLNTPPNLLKIFVANRIAQILELTDKYMWNYVQSSCNPADIASRGISPSDLQDSKLWWNGPEFLSTTNDKWPDQPNNYKKEVPELRSNSTCLISKSQIRFTFDIQRFSTMNKLYRSVAYCLRFIHNIKSKKKDRQVGYLNLQEISQAKIIIIKQVQCELYAQELHDLEKHGHVQRNSSIISLNPFLDKEGLLRVGGRLQLSSLHHNEKHPIILDSKHYFTKLIFKDAHLRLAHAGAQQILSHVRESYWPTRARSSIKQIVRDCIICFRANPKNNNPQMGVLPRQRINPSFPFEFTGVDYGGPFFIKQSKGRGSKTAKCYIAVFICLVIKAIHIEIVSDLSTETFLAALKRFLSRRGKPKEIFSDNGTNFTGADKEIKRLTQLLNSDHEKINDFLVNEGVIWKFIPPHSPHFGGIWESGIKQAKFHLKRLMHNLSFTYEEFSTLCCQIEAILNSRPITPMTEDPFDLEVLSPSHFLIGRKITALPEPDLQTIKSGRLNHYQRIQQLMQQFWTRWSHEYLQSLQQRRKWQLPNIHLLREGDLVLLREDNQPPLSWPRGRILTLHPGPDRISRVATVKTAKGTFKRAIVKLYPLPATIDAPCA